jgi:hypothetical protein
MSQAFEQALALVRMDPLPTDAYAQMTALEDALDPAEEERFGDLWEALYAAGVQLPSD